ncbi:hypothetical protein [Vibrio cholerae]|uniref:hypothetical protein n=1 Tax=Vibrio cholerae TaxID=666 RepID=UPI0006E69445|nr:hypothetical protein [Vibrio cholerae]EJL6615470.1 hypothetical protein [Vibrio cholerae]KQA34789.1 hypothetical protein XV74_17685 [Vibrio cholerae]KQA40695.1 hypothetical protein XV75_17865 [Vibrio cholerae]KQA52847.1 hypothetical protein XV79_17785 [Vibrio cholerae]KQA73173.1 hypothetical protein XV84_13400 [Vibrio cholerae]
MRRNNLEAAKQAIKDAAKMGSYHETAYRVLPVLHETMNNIMRSRSKRKNELCDDLIKSVKPELIDCWQSGKSFKEGNHFMQAWRQIDWVEQGLDGDESEYCWSSELPEEMLSKLLPLISDDLTILPETLTLYRGGDLNGFSWTTDFKTAEEFADATTGHIHTLIINKEHILAVFNSRGEYEVVIHPYDIDKGTLATCYEL